MKYVIILTVSLVSKLTIAVLQFTTKLNKNKSLVAYYNCC